jgi:hypothetical protein
MFDHSIGSLVSTYLTTLIVADVVRSSHKHTRYHLEFFVMADTDMVKFYFLGILIITAFCFLLPFHLFPIPTPLSNPFHSLCSSVGKKLVSVDIAVERIMSQGWFTLLRGEQELVKIRILNMIGLTKKL